MMSREGAVVQRPMTATVIGGPVFTGRHMLYRLYDAAENLLYVGITCSVGNRFYQHARQHSWWSEVADCVVTFFPDRTTLEVAEQSAIREEVPRYNIIRRAVRRAESIKPARAADVPEIERVPPAYEQIAEHYRRAIRAGTCAPGDEMPSSRALKDEWGVTLKVAHRGLALLRDEGWIITRPGKPAVVAATSPSPGKDQP